MLIGFQAKFKTYVKDGSKHHTIRAWRKRGDFRAGEVCHCYTGLRTKKRQLLGRWRCVKVDPIQIKFTYSSIIISIDEIYLSDSEAAQLAWRDGFRPEGSTERTPGKALALMRQFWIEKHKLTLPAMFHGAIIHWDYNQPVAAPRRGTARKPRTRRTGRAAKAC